MTTQSQAQDRGETPERSTSADTMLGFAVLGLFAAGAVGIVKALDMQNGFDVLLCLLGSVAAFGAVAYICLGKR